MSENKNVLKISQFERRESNEFKCDDETHRGKREDNGFHEDIEEAVKTIRKSKTAKTVYLDVGSAGELNALFSAIVENCSEIEHFEVEFAFGKITEALMSILLKAFNEKLRHFIVKECRLKCEMYPLGNAPVSFGNPTITELFKKCPNLELLVLDGGTGVDGEGLLNIPRTVKSLHLPLSWWSEKQMSDFAARNGRYIEEFELGAIDGPQFDQICKNMINLKTLILHTLNINFADSILLLSNLEKLENIEIGLSGFDLDDQLLIVLPKLTHLKRVYFTKCGITDKSLALFPKYCPQLEHIFINNYNEEAKVTKVSIKALSELKNLKTLSIPDAKVSKKCIKDFKKKCKNVDTTLDNDY